MRDINLDELTRDYKVFVDTCSLMHDGCEPFFLNCLNAFLQKNSTKIFIPVKVIGELEKFSKDISNQNRQKDALRALKVVRTYRSLGLTDERGDENEPFADAVFQMVFTKFLTKYNLCLITNDNSLSFDILSLKRRKSIQTNKAVRVFRLLPSGSLAETSYEYLLKRFSQQDQQGQNNNSKSNNNHTSLPIKSNQIKKFNIAQTPADHKKNTQIQVKSLPKAGDTVALKSGKRIRLVSLLGSGGEGSIFLTDRNDICKIYYRERLTRFREEKISLMLSNPFSFDGICWPNDMVLNAENVFAGYTMPKADGKSMQSSMFVKPLLQKNFPTWTKKNLVNLLLTTLRKIAFLHERNVILGDINPLNILIKDDKTVYFVDTDSYQIEKYPCPVGTVNFTPPERQGLNYETFLRNLNDELFAVGTLVFMVLMPGKPPYSQLGGSNPAENIRKMDFSYPFKDKSNKKYPDGPWRFIWSHFPFKIKEAFYETFRENKRKPVSVWISLLENYLYSLENGHVSDEMFPRSLKELSEYAKQEYGVTSEQGLDKNGKPKIRVICIDCQKSYFVPEEIVKRIQTQGIPSRCFDCQEVLRNTGVTIRCNQCGNSFLFSKAEAEFYAKKNFTQPKKCETCRKQSKSNPVRRVPTYRPAPRQNDSWCFISSAILHALGKSDDCYELQILRTFRDSILLWGKHDYLVGEYYEIAPSIVESLKKHPYREALYWCTYEEFLSPIIQFVETQSYERAIEKYGELVKFLISIREDNHE